jgi:hypothetical protein
MEDAMEQAVRTLQDRINAALLGSDWQALDELVSPNAPIIAPEGVIITRDKWIGVHNESDYQPVRLETSETDVHTYDHGGIRFDVVDSECTCKGGNHRRSLQQPPAAPCPEPETTRRQNPHRARRRQHPRSKTRPAWRPPPRVFAGRMR